MDKLYFPKNYTIYVPTPDLEMSRRKLEGLQKYAEIQNWGRRRPDLFIKEFVGFELLDIQTYLLMNSWSCPNNIWLECRGAGKSTMIAIFIMAKSLLFNNYESYIAAGSSDQAISTFTKIEALSTDAIESATNLSKSFLDELKIGSGVGGATGNGFVHNPMGYNFQLWNGSKCTSLNSNINAKRGKRSNLVVFDETGFLPEEMLAVYTAFTAVAKGFKLGGDIDIRTLPRSFANQIIFASSASSVDTPYYTRVVDYTKKYIAGDPNYFICDITADTMINATFHGDKYPASLLSQETVDAEMRANPDKALREYYNVFSTVTGINQIISRNIILRNSSVYPPVLFNDTSDRQFVLAYDPARNSDNSIVAVGEIIKDPVKGYMMKIVNCVNFLDLSLRKKKPKITTDQISELKAMLVDYNGNALDWDNIHLLIDAGSGGGGNRLPEEFFNPFKDKQGIEHRGLIDSEYSEEYLKRFPDAVKDHIHFLEPSKYKSDMYEALIKMVEADLIKFSDTYDNKGYLNIIHYQDDILAKSEAQIRAKLDKMNLSIQDYEYLLSESMSKIDSATSTIYKLAPDEAAALTQIDAMKEEIVNICRIKRDGGKDSFKLPSHKDADLGGESESTMHDDRAYCLSMLGWYLFNLRQAELKKQKKPKTDPRSMVGIGKKAKKWKKY